MLKDQKACEKRISELEKLIARKAEKRDVEEKAVLDKVKELFDQKKWVKDATWLGREIVILNTFNFLTAKPVVYLVNISETEYKTKK
jgi:obg-like ATPase 1